jgi:hypothetical protein
MDGRYAARYYVNDKKLKVQISRQKYLAVFLLNTKRYCHEVVFHQYINTVF